MGMAVACGALAFAGCGSEGPERAIVSGTVSYGGEPIKAGQIRFIPSKGTKAPTSGAEIIDGRYTAEARGGVPVGTHRVEILAHRPNARFRELTESLPPDATELERPPRQQYMPAKYNTNSELEITIEPGSGTITENYELTE